MLWFVIIIFLICYIFCITYLLYYYTEPKSVKTKIYSNYCNDDIDSIFIILFLVFNIFCFIFIKHIKKHRKIRYYKKVLSDYKYQRYLYCGYLSNSNNTERRARYDLAINKITRLLKLQKLN